MSFLLAVRLSIMMFLQFFIWGSWYVTVGNYIAAEGKADMIHWAYTVGPIAALISPFLMGRVADRYFPVENVLGVLNLVAGIAMVGATWVGASGGGVFIFFLLMHTLSFFPTIGLTSTLTFHNMTHPEKQFPLIRVYGSVGWVMAGVLVSYVLKADETVLPLQVAACASLMMGLYCFTLPHTPPKARSSGKAFRDILGLDTLKHLNTRPFIVFVLCELLISIPLSTYYAFGPVYINAAGIESPASLMSLGQVMEVMIMFTMPLVLLRLGVKQMIVIGFGAWVLRFVLFASSAPDDIFWMILGGILLHGICFDFVYIAGQIFVDRQVTPAMRGQAQGFLVMVRSGIGLSIGAQLSGWLFNRLLNTDATNMEAWSLFWAIPAAMSLVILLFFGVFFSDDRR